MLPYCFSPTCHYVLFLNESQLAMRSGRSTWRPLFRTTERSWPLKTLPRRSSPRLLDIQWVGQVRNDTQCTSVLLYVLSTPSLLPPFPPSLHPTIASSHLLIFPLMASYPLLRHLFSCIFLCIGLSSSSSTTHLFAAIASSTPLILSTLLPRLRSLMNIKRRARLFTLSDWLQTLFLHSRYFVHLFLFQTASFHAITFLWI